MKKSAWKKFKLFVLGIIGQSTADKLSLLQKQFASTLHRFLRSVRGNNADYDEFRVTRYSADNRQTFFGYYDVSPFSKNNSLLLAMTTKIGNRPPTPGDSVKVGYFDYKNSDEFRHVGTTSTWCWQQGCRLRWYPADENKLILYNKLINGTYASVIQNVIDESIVNEFDFPIYDVQESCDQALTLNFSRLGRLRPGYGYTNLPDTTSRQKAPNDDGVWVVDLNSSDKRLLLSLQEISELDPEPSMVDADHYFNHISVSPYDDTFMCFHLWSKNSVTHNRLVVCGMNGDGLKLFSTSGVFSHYTWSSASELLLTIFHSKQRAEYVRYNIQTDTRTKMDDGMLLTDGHPTWSPDGNTLLTDTYPDKYDEQSVIIYTEAAGGRVIKKFPTPIALSYRHGGEVRCDLHPRWDRDGGQVCVDSAAGGKRSLYVLAVE